MTMAARVGRARRRARGAAPARHERRGAREQREEREPGHQCCDLRDGVGSAAGAMRTVRVCVWDATGAPPGGPIAGVLRRDQA